MFFPSFSSLILTGGKTLIFPLSSEFKCPLPGWTREYFASNCPLSPSHKKNRNKTRFKPRPLPRRPGHQDPPERRRRRPGRTATARRRRRREGLKSAPLDEEHRVILLIQIVPNSIESNVLLLFKFCFQIPPS